MPSDSTIWETIFAMPRGKVSGPYGFSVEFFTSSWDIVDSNLIKAVQNFVVGGCLKKANATAISLIPKRTGADKLTDFRPISCCNTYYKVIYRIIASRLKLFVSQAVQRNQVGFIEGRLLCDNVLLASELVSGLHKAGSISRGCLLINLTKAYDSLD